MNDNRLEKLINHIYEISHYQIQESTDRALLMAISDCFPAHETSIINIDPLDQSQLYKTLTLDNRDSQPVIRVDNRKVQINKYINCCIDQQKTYIETISATEYSIYLPITMRGKPLWLVQVILSTSVTEHIKHIENLISIYQNHSSLIFENEHDILTGLLNRKTFEYKLNTLLGMQQSNHTRTSDHNNNRRTQHNYDKHFWLGLIDIDHFKNINDTYGHLYGDEVLLILAQLMKKSFRMNDLLFRYGGEEFLVILDSTSEEQAKMIFERFRQLIEEHHLPQIGHITISLGITNADPSSPSSTIIDQADQALYYAKNNGRNQALCYGTLVEQGKIQPHPSDGDIELF